MSFHFCCKFSSIVLLRSNRRSSINRSLPRPRCCYFVVALSLLSVLLWKYQESLTFAFLKCILFSKQGTCCSWLFTKLFVDQDLKCMFSLPKYCNQQENIEKPTVASFRLTTRNLKLLFYFVLCRFFVHLYVCNTNFHLVRKQFVSGSLRLPFISRSFFRSLGSYPAELYSSNEVLFMG